MVSEVTLQWMLGGSVAGYSVIHFADGTSGAAMSSGTASLQNLAASFQPDSVSSRPLGEIRNLSTATGQLQSIASFFSPATVTGTLTGQEILPQNVSLGIDWFTAGIVNGRRVRGRTFIPFIAQSQNVDGQPDPGMTGSFALTGRVVWSRPLLPARAGTAHPVTSANIKRSEWATQGSRRRA